MTAPPDTTSVQLAFKATSSSNASSNVSATLTDRRNHLLINLNPNMSNFVSAVVHIDSMAQTNTSTLKTFPLRPGQNYIGTTSTVSPTDIRYNFENMTRYSIKIVVLSKEVGTTPSSISSYFSYGTESVTQNLECYNYLFREDGGDNFNNPQIVNIGGIEKNSDIEIDCLLHALYPADIRAPHHVLFTFDEEDKYKDPDSSPPVNTDNSEQLAEYSVYLPYKSGGKYKLTNNLLNNDSVYAVTISGIYSDGQVVSVTVTDRIHVITSPKILEVIAYDPERIDPHPSGEQSSTSTVMNVYLDPASAPIKVKPSDSKITFYLTQNNIIRYKSEVEYTSFVLNDGENEYTVMNDANFTKLAQPESNNHTFSVYAEIKYKNLNGGVDIIKTSNKLTEKFASDIVSLPASGIHLDNAWTASSVTTTVNGTRQVDLADAISYDGYHNAPEFGLVGTLRKTDQYGSGRGNDELFGDLDLVDTHHKFNLSVGEGENQMVSHVKYMYQEQEAKLIRRPGISKQNGVNKIRTEESMVTVRADSKNIISYSTSIPESNSLEEQGWSIVNTGPNTNGATGGAVPKVNLYYFGNTTPAASQTATNSFKLSQVNGLGLFALFNQNQGAKEYPFFIVYTTPTGNPHDRTVNKSWYKSKVFYGPSSAGGDTTTPNSHRAGLTLLYTGTDDGSLFPDVPASRRVKCEINNLNSDKFDNYADELVNSVTLQTSSNASESQAGSFNFRLLETGLFTSHTHFKKFALRYNQPRAKLLYHPNGMFPNIPDKASGVGKYNPGTQQRRILYYIPSSQNNLYSQTDKVKVLIAVLAYNLTHSQHVYTVPDPTASPQKTVVHKINRYTMTLGTASEPNYSGTGNAGKLDIPINNPNDAQNDFYMRAAAFESNLGATITEPLPANSNGGSFNITINNPNQSFRGVNSSGVTYKVFYVVNDPNVSATATINGPISEPYTIQLKDNPTSDNFAITDYSYTTFNNEGKSSFKFKVNFIDGDKTSIDGIRVYFVTDNNNSAVSTHIPSTLLKDVNRVGHVSNNFIEYILQPHGPTGPTSSALNNGVKIIDNELTPSTNTWLNFRSGTINFVPYFTQKANTSNDPNRTDVAEALTGKKINNIPVIDPVDSSSVSLTGGVIQSLTATRIQWSDDNSKYGSVNDVVSATYDVNGQVNNSNLATITLSDNVSTYTNVIKVKITAINDSSVYYSQPITLKFDSVSVDQSAMTISVKRGTNSDVLRTTRGNYSADKLANLNVASLKLVHKKGETEDPTNVDILLYQVQDTVPPTVPPAVQPVGSDSNPNVYDTSSYSLGTVLKLIYRIEAGVKFTINTDDVRDSTPLYLALNSPFQYVVAEKPSLSISPSYKVVDGKMSMGVSIDAKGLHNEGLQGVVFVLAQEGDFTNPNDQDSNGASVTLVFNSSQAIHTYESQGNALQSSSADNMAKMETFIFTDRNGGEWKLTTGDLGPTDKSVIEFPANYGGFHNTKPLLAVGIASTRLGTVATDGFLDITPPLIL